jgi:hypothetical protein
MIQYFSSSHLLRWGDDARGGGKARWLPQGAHPWPQRSSLDLTAELRRAGNGARAEPRSRARGSERRGGVRALGGVASRGRWRHGRGSGE